VPPLGRPQVSKGLQMLAYRKPTLAAFLGAIEQDVRDGIALLSARTKAAQRCVPNRLPRSKRPHLAQSDPILLSHLRRPSAC
jgi:hypothetical protein